MAVHQATRSTAAAQPRARQTKDAAGPSVKTQAQGGTHQHSHQFKAELLKSLERLNCGYGMALNSLDRLRAKDRLPGRRIFPAECLNDLRNRTEELRALANRDLLRLLAEHEEQEAVRFGSPGSD